MADLQNRRLQERQIAIAEVLLSRTLTDCGEVAEWPKAEIPERA